MPGCWLFTRILAVTNPPFLKAEARAWAHLPPGWRGAPGGGRRLASAARPVPTRRPCAPAPAAGDRRSRISPRNPPPGASLTYGRALLLVKPLTSLDHRLRGTTTFSHPRARATRRRQGRGRTCRDPPNVRSLPVAAPGARRWRRDSAGSGQTPDADLKARRDLKEYTDTDAKVKKQDDPNAKSICLYMSVPSNPFTSLQNF